MKYFFFLLIFISVISCVRQNNVPKSGTAAKPYFATSFTVETKEHYSILKVINPWQAAQNIVLTYVLGKSPYDIPDSLRVFPFIRTPVKRVVAMSSTHIGFISALDQAFNIVGISGEEFINDSIVLRSFKEGRCFDVGYAPNLNYEKILSLQPDLVFLYGVDASVQGIYERLMLAGIRSVIVSEYLEIHPLGKAEWIKFFGALYGKINMAEAIFDSISNNYIRLRDSVATLKEKPTVLAGLPWKDTWFLPGGNSYQARIIKDAGGLYLWEDDNSNETIPLDLESAFLRASEANIWINTGTAASKAELLMRDQRFGLIEACKKGQLYNNDARLSSGGGNDYWESGVIHPDIILRDLTGIFHPGFLSKHDLFYYRKLE